MIYTKRGVSYFRDLELYAEIIYLQSETLNSSATHLGMKEAHLKAKQSLGYNPSTKTIEMINVAHLHNPVADSLVYRLN